MDYGYRVWCGMGTGYRVQGMVRNGYWVLGLRVVGAVCSLQICLHVIRFNKPMDVDNGRQTSTDNSDCAELTVDYTHTHTHTQYLTCAATCHSNAMCKS